ncbi:hypothetical protein KC19_10G150800 [Ceratodon purpureus]|uniref:Uncharacterized protein n=1 Tax=Ceratodon purpureus TaxID=3225 RepID=A0A8T0GPB6_CERPU|nr:hypothetical protein KC19_10G150800 [Ceratodon purpureus]
MGGRHMQLLGAIWVTVVVAICAFSYKTDAHEYCRPGFATCHKGRLCKTQVSCDPQNCGKCGVRCPDAAHGQGKCEKGRCSLECQWRHGWRDCDSKKGNGCETNVDTNPKHCGECGKVCPDPPAHAIATCSRRDGCGIQCDAGFSKCGTQCLNLKTDAANCGTCGKVCPAPANGIANCSGGTCGVRCDDGFRLCGGECRNVDSDASNCGFCNNACLAPANATVTCSGGTCGFQCGTLMGKCSGGPLGDRCSNFREDVNDCGDCDRTCPTTDNGTAKCSSEVCSVECNAGFRQCNGECMDAVNNCGGCGIQCPTPTQAHAVAHCTEEGTCGFQCAPGFLNCNGECVDVSSDDFNCGDCGINCAFPLMQGCFCLNIPTRCRRACIHGACSTGCPIDDGDEFSTDPMACANRCEMRK